MRKIGAVMIASLLILVACQKSSAPEAKSLTPTQPQKSSSISKEQAMELVQNLPEIKAWSELIAKKKDSHRRAVIMIDGDIAEPIKGKDGKFYWPVGFLEDTGSMMHRWESFLVRLDGKTIMIENNVDPAAGMLTLEQWRKARKGVGKNNETP